MIFLLGGNGFLGSAIYDYFKKKNKIIIKIDRKNYYKYKKKSCSLLINSSTNSKKYISEKNPLYDFNNTVLNVRKSIEDFDFKKYLLISSGDVYSSEDRQKLEDNFLPSSLHYGFHKLLAENCVKNYCDDWIILRLGGLIGKNLSKNIIFDLLNGFPIRFSKKSKFQFINTTDVSKIIMKILSMKKKNLVLNVSGKGQISVNDIIKIYRKYKNSKKIKFLMKKSFINFDINTNKLQKFYKIKSTKQAVDEFLCQNLKED